ncbi:uncharacterized protein N7483_007349 [Penicillium malachiteum]|uniref:uncharacterized protein n=1 Tax=Penicillium malachiteum TaxID=1324776 RepID=UPI0025498440|nr:uncharacterized protein N7483_007349 [Penicillium malachiteum]KAJ5725992.1 hypothetical protein N7483_007349 [Penicillium malachiteum]
MEVFLRKVYFTIGNSLSPINKSCLCGKHMDEYIHIESLKIQLLTRVGYKITENGYISIAATQDTTNRKIGSRKCALSMIYGLRAKESGKLIAKSIWIIRSNCSAAIL